MKVLIAAGAILGIATMAPSAATGGRRNRELVLRPQDQHARRQAGRPREVPRQGVARRERGEQVRVHAAVRRPREAAARDEGQDFNVLGFPSNDFGGQEPGTAVEIAEFCRLTYDVTFPMFEKVVTQGRAPASRRSTPSSASPATCRPGTSASTSSTRTGRIVAFFPSKVDAGGSRHCATPSPRRSRLKLS